jgi:hypothetical protein
MSQDMKPGKNTTDYMKKIAPYARWAHQGHGLVGAVNDLPCGYVTTVWQAQFPTPNNYKPEENRRTYGWQSKGQVCSFLRWIWKPCYPTQLAYSREIGEMNIAGKQRGFGRTSADLWPCIKDSRGRMASLSARYPLANWVQLNLLTTPYLYADAGGAQGTIRFEMTREGVQECEARIFVEKVLLDKALRAKIGEDLAKRAQDLLDDRVRAIFDVIADYDKEPQRFADSGWQDRSAKLFAIAGEVAKALRTQ